MFAKYHDQKRSIVNSIATYDAQLTKSSSNLSVTTANLGDQLESDAKSECGNLVKDYQSSGFLLKLLDFAHEKFAKQR